METSVGVSVFSLNTDVGEISMAHVESVTESVSASVIGAVRIIGVSVTSVSVLTETAISVTVISSVFTECHHR